MIDNQLINQSDKKDFNAIYSNHKLTIPTHNVQSISNNIKQNQLIQHLQLNNIDILGLSETNLKPVEAKHFHLHNSQDYTYFFSCSTNNHVDTGVRLIVNKNISMHIFNKGMIEGRAIFVNIHSKGKQVIRIIQIYLHANKLYIKDRKQLQRQIFEIVQQVQTRHYHVIVMGDFNFDPKHRNVTAYNKQKLDFILNLEANNLHDTTNLVYDITPDTPHNTWFKPNSNIASRIDMIWCTDRLAMDLIDNTLTRTELYGSDHLLITSTFTTDMFNFKNHARLRQHKVLRITYCYDQMIEEK